MRTITFGLAFRQGKPMAIKEYNAYSLLVKRRGRPHTHQRYGVTGAADRVEGG
jgi:hypothetical protein